jgi:hypothetical protein
MRLLEKSQVKAIKEALANNHRAKDIASYFGLHPSAITRIKKGVHYYGISSNTNRI